MIKLDISPPEGLSVFTGPWTARSLQRERQARVDIVTIPVNINILVFVQLSIQKGTTVGACQLYQDTINLKSCVTARQASFGKVNSWRFCEGWVRTKLFQNVTPYDSERGIKDTQSCHHKSRQVADWLTHHPVSDESAACREGKSDETNQLLGDREVTAAYHSMQIMNFKKIVNSCQEFQ